MDEDHQLARRLARSWRRDPNWVIRNPKNYVGAALARCVDLERARRVLDLAQIELTGMAPQPPGLLKTLQTVGIARIPTLDELILSAKNFTESEIDDE